MNMWFYTYGKLRMQNDKLWFNLELIQKEK